MDEDIEFQLPSNKPAPKSEPALPQKMEVNVDLGDLMKNDFAKIQATLEKGITVNFPELQKVTGTVSLDDKHVEVDFRDVLDALNRIEESSKNLEQSSDSLKTNQKESTTESVKAIREIRTSIVKAIKQSIEQRPEVVVNQPDKITATIVNKKPSEAIPVTLTDKAQKKFVEAITNVINNSGGGGGGLDTSGLISLLEQIKDNTADLEIKIDSVNLNTDTLEAKLQTIADNTDTVETKLQAISDNTDTVESKLQSIADNTDTVEAKLDTANTSLANAVANQTNGTELVTMNDVNLSLKQIINLLARPIWVDQTTGTLRAYLTGNSGTTQSLPWMVARGFWTSASSVSGTAGDFLAGDTYIRAIDKQSWSINVRERIN